MTPNWKTLAPHRPVEPGQSLYVQRPDIGGKRLADLVRGGLSTLLVVGPLGIGKSTELAHAARLLGSDRLACLVQLGGVRSENMRQISADQVLVRIAGQLALEAIQGLGLPLSGHLRGSLVALSALSPDLATDPLAILQFDSGRAAVEATLREVARLSQRPVTILVDGLERTPEHHTRRVFEALADLPEPVELVVVVPWHAAYGPNAQEIIRPGEKLVALRPVEVAGDAGKPGRKFLSTILATRLELLAAGVLDEVLGPQLYQHLIDAASLPPESMLAVVRSAAEFSGGVPRTFLQLISDAAAYARLDRGGDWPEQRDLANAVRDQVESTRRLLLPGDEHTLRTVNGTDGREVDLSRKLRLLQNGLLLERETPHGTELRLHPLVHPLIAGSLAAAPHG